MKITITTDDGTVLSAETLASDADIIAGEAPVDFIEEKAGDIARSEALAMQKRQKTE